MRTWWRPVAFYEMVMNAANLSASETHSYLAEPNSGRGRSSVNLRSPPSWESPTGQPPAQRFGSRPRRRPRSAAGFADWSLAEAATRAAAAAATRASRRGCGAYTRAALRIITISHQQALSYPTISINCTKAPILRSQLQAWITAGNV